MAADLLNPHRFTTAIAKHPDFHSSMPRQDIDTMSRADMQKQRGRAVRMGSLALAHERSEKHGEYDLDANLFTLVANTEGLLTAHQSVAAFKEKYDDSQPSYPSSGELARYRADKAKIIAFNHAVKEAINAGGTKFNFSELLTFMTNMHTAISGSTEQQQQFHHVAREILIGMRNEVAFEQVLIAAGIEYTVGTAEQDAKGGDFIINHTAIDVKASEISAQNARKKAYQHGYDPTHIIWSQIDFEDFGGALVLPQDIVTKKIPAVHTLVSIATQSRSSRQNAS